MKFDKIVLIWLTDFETKDISFGIHVCWKGRIDFHFLFWMLSIGKIPIYKNQNGKRFAVSNSYHESKNVPLRAGTPKG